MKNSLTKNMMNTIDFRNEGYLYIVEPIVSTTVCWEKISDVNDMNQATTLHFDALNGRELYAKFVRVEDKSYWKMYIKSASQIDIVYVQTATLNPVGKYRK